jgi:hypothetical protein
MRIVISLLYPASSTSPVLMTSKPRSGMWQIHYNGPWRTTRSRSSARRRQRRRYLKSTPTEAALLFALVENDNSAGCCHFRSLEFLRNGICVLSGCL